MAISTVRKGRDEARAGARPDDQRQGKGRQGEPELVDVHDFSSDAVGKAIPYGVSDIAANDGLVSVGIDHDTPVFALTSIEAWWKKVGLQRYPGVGGHQIPRPLGEDRGGVISPVHHSPVKIWAGGLRAA
jgi:hypothetical protein